MEKSKEAPSEKKKEKVDLWAEIRGMRNVDEIIADLESGGVTSLRDLRSFFWNFKHDDDHTDELSELKTKVKAIYSYEQADQYIKEYIKDYAVDGKALKRSKLEQMLIDLKMEYNALVPEHNALLKKKAAATPYTKTVRTYLENQKKQERDRQYRERKFTQQKKKDTLE